MSQTPHNVAIIGAGLAGLALALSLHQQKIPCTIYESRSAPLNIGGAIMLSPNALKCLSALGVYDRIKSKGYNFSMLSFRDLSGREIEDQEFGSKERYGFDALRIYRYELINELLLMMEEKELVIEFGRKFARIVEETADGVTWEFTDGTQSSAALLVGADGIHSTVRKHLYPNLQTKFTGMAGITAAVPTKQLKLPQGYYIPVTIVSEKGAFVIAPQLADGSEVLIGKQRTIEDHDHAGWDALMADKEDMVKFLQKDNELFPEFVHNAASHIDPSRINVWPFYIVPKLEKWASPNRRVIILGDAAHAIPPTAGQGINQAFEDVYMFALLLGKAGAVKMEDALSFWQKYRQERVDKVLELNDKINLRRGSRDLSVELEKIDVEWLFKPDFKEVVDTWIAEQNRK
jgi:2-polyprenyl-6-methoxyphenol hydroxylase-like FAD-dependent oxidoreductase